MRVSLNWLNEFVNIDLEPSELAHKLMMLGLDVESVDYLGAEISNVVVGKILSIEPHPAADKLVVCQTDIGEGDPLQIVCGAKNMSVGDKVPTAKVGATLPGGITIGRRKMRGIESCGMMCSGKELGVSDDQEGLLILSPDAPIGADICVVLGLDDYVFDIEITPNRGDWAGMIGVARDLAAAFGSELHIPSAEVEENDQCVENYSSVVIEDTLGCPRYIGRVLLDVEIKPSPEWMQQRLRAAGQRPINNIVDITNYIMLETGQPLHAFDYDKLIENRIVVRRARPAESLRTIDGIVRPLSPEMLVIADAQNPVALAGIMGGADTEVTEATKRVFLESAFFDPITIRRTAKALSLMTEAAQRFQRGADPEMTKFAINRAARLMKELAGATVTTGLLDVYPNPKPTKEITLRFARTNLLLGTNIPSGEQTRYLKGLGFVPTQTGENSAVFCVPSWRHDCQQEADLIEEIARLYGYDLLETPLPVVRRSDQVFAPEEKRTKGLRHRLLESGLTEMMNMTFISPKDITQACLPDTYLDMVKLANPLSENYSGMRTSLLPGIIRAAAHSARRGIEDICVFEIGPVYRPQPDADLPKESLHLAILLSGSLGGKHWSSPLRNVDFYDIKGYVELVFEYFGDVPVCETADFGPLDPREAARVALGDIPVGWMGRLNRKVTATYDLEKPVYVAELNLEPLLGREWQTPTFEPIPAFPAALRDLAVVVDQSVPAAAILETVKLSRGTSLVDVRVFDVYVGNQIPPGKKSVALALKFQSMERTLTEDEVQESCDTILRKLKQEFGAELR
ncbi:MAG TPA: phenylalanine--tRNA ligase subunit beta [Candidatus Hydrogenedentes bacterium]|nr:phenylalanine--tRNA ligase subunit beta [Candidatus Hydrogenedentota bacterium]HOL75773.1 phenylalanine--tRNA ligase subunit beta [Candidatus Hydrogenedentota bacterium]HPO84234.1 phenylalanine--tRNA ligase subunit beta [Candidatus Hydrogenedentota bacterium]